MRKKRNRGSIVPARQSARLLVLKRKKLNRCPFKLKTQTIIL
jgi:hypothetical protein